jgi:NNP family nitrate/nitrite transporter-like MFS transporter
MALSEGTVTQVSPSGIEVSDRSYSLVTQPERTDEGDGDFLPWPMIESWQVPAVEVGDVVRRRQLLASGTTHIYFQANVWVFTLLVFVIGIAMGIGKAAVYKYIPNYFPNEVGVVGGMVGVLGGLGGFVCPIIFGSLLDSLGLWTTTWMFLLGVTGACLIWLSLVVRRMSRHI